MSIDPLTAALDLGKTLISTIWPNPADQARENRLLAELAQKGNLAELQAHVSILQGQMAINAVEAKHPSIFVAGWRPFVGWVGGFSLLYAAILEPFMRFVATMAGYTGAFPELNLGVVTTVLLGMLGIGAQRSYDKSKGTHTSNVGE